MAKPPKLHRRNGVYYYRARVPTEVLSAISNDPATWRRHTSRRGGMVLENWKPLIGKGGIPKQVLWVSLRQSNRKEAETAFFRKQVEINDLFAAVLKVFRRQGSIPTMSDAERLARDWFRLMEARQAAAQTAPPSSDGTEDEVMFLLKEDLALAKGRHSSYNDPNEPLGDPATAARLLAEPGFIIDEESPEFIHLSELIRRGHIELARRAIDRENRDFGRSYDEFFKTTADVHVDVRPQQRNPHYTLSKLIEEYTSERANDVSSKTLVSYSIAFRVLKDVIGSETPTSLLSRADCKRYVGVLRRLPPNYTKKLKGFDAVKAADIAEKQGLKPMSVNTANGYIDNASALLEWAIAEGRVATNFFNKLTAGTDTIAKEDRRKPFSIDDLKTLFSQSVFSQGSEAGVRQEPRKFWAPLIGLFSGLRLNEILQMRLQDLRMKDGVLCFDVSNREIDGEVASDKRIKNKSSRRFVPVHSVLKRIGLLRYAEDMKEKGETRLFPDAALGSDGTYSSPFSKGFARFLRKTREEVGASFIDRGQRFHSFRHNFRDELRNNGVDRELAHALGGWSLETSGDRYGDGFHATKYADAIEKLRYEGLDLSHLYWP